MARFSERIGHTPPKTVLQLDSMDDELRNGLWNVCFTQVMGMGSPTYYSVESLSPALATFIYRVWGEYLKQPFDALPRDIRSAIAGIRNRCFKTDWAGMYDFVEFVLTVAPVDTRSLILECNRVLEQERSGYRLVNARITAISATEEMSAVQTASELEGPSLRANIAETLLVHSITEQGGKEIQHEEYEDILSGPVGGAR